MADTEKLVFMVTHGPAEPELATIPFVMAAAALASDVAVVMGFQGDGVELVKAGVAETVAAPEFPPLAKLLADVRELGGLAARLQPVPQEPRHRRAGRPRRGRRGRRRRPVRRRDHVRHQRPDLLGEHPP